MALSDRDCRHGRQIGKCADCDLDHMEMVADAEARRVDELTALRKQDDALIKQMLEALTLTERYLEIEVGSAYGRDTHISKIKEYESRLKKHKKCITAARKRLENT